MWNPLSLPLALLGAVAAVPRAMMLLEEAVVQAAALNETGSAALKRVDELNKRGDLVLAELAEASETFAQAREEARLAVAAIEAARPTAERIADSAGPMIAAAEQARDQLRETQAVLERASEQIARALEMAEPLDRMTTRAQKLLRRDS
jgi:hypothetical protein